jgi:hypothetical protein
MTRSQVGLMPMSEKTSPGEVNIIHNRWTAEYFDCGDDVGGCANSGS